MLTKQKQHKKSICAHILDDFRYSLSVSSVSGLNQAVLNDGRTWFERLFWILVVVLSTLVGTWQALIVYKHYDERPVIITVEKNYREWELEYPAFTICFRELDSDLYKNPEVVSKKLNLSRPLMDEKEQEEFLQYISDLAFSDYLSYDRYEHYANGSKKEWLTPDRYMDVLDNAVKKWALQKSRTVHKTNAHMNPLNKGDAVYLRIFTELGICETLNPWVGLYLTKEYINFTGIILNYTQILYKVEECPAKWTMSNVRFTGDDCWVYIHSSRDIIEISGKKNKIDLKSYFLLFVELDSSIVIISHRAQNLTVRQKDCRLPFDQSEPALKHSPIYSRNLCKTECRINMALKFCNCTPYYYRRTDEEAICNMTGMYCLSKYKSYFLNPPNCECPQNCNVSTYFLKTILQTNEFAYASIFSMTMSMPQQLYVRNLVFTPIDLTVQIGGILGLFLGSSILSMVELVYFVTLRLFFGLKSRLNTKKRKQNIEFTH